MGDTERKHERPENGLAGRTERCLGPEPRGIEHTEALANLLKEQEARVRGKEDFAKALESERSALRDGHAALIELHNELDSLRSSPMLSLIQPSLDNVSVAIAHDRLQPKTSGDQP
ncbi:hypothetical protein J2X90_006040 [Variovorax paradoxus]|uniref:hypothetical protein n=1 Tax=Variovorax paradoxus TaxID=34073 RepID=UPI0027848810|nr:hypothetical protein [Variovorax paradoxus]MDQ0028187.1 hypothetical protein [Variovorax paradoxus]